MDYSKGGGEWSTVKYATHALNKTLEAPEAIKDS